MRRTKHLLFLSLPHPSCSYVRPTKDCDFRKHPFRMETITSKCDATRYYDYHQDMRHHTIDCKVLKDFIGRLIADSTFKRTLSITSKPSTKLLTRGYLQRRAYTNGYSSICDSLSYYQLLLKTVDIEDTYKTKCIYYGYCINKNKGFFQASCHLKLQNPLLRGCCRRGHPVPLGIRKNPLLQGHCHG